MRVTFEVEWESWRWRRRWDWIRCYFLGHPRYASPPASSIFRLGSGPHCIRCGARPPHYEEPGYFHQFNWAEHPFGQPAEVKRAVAKELRYVRPGMVSRLRPR